MTHLILVRHGESIWHQENRYAGSSDIGLTPRGYRDAELLADWARTARLDALWVSSLSRTQETARPVARVTGLEPHIDARLRELGFGQGEGRTRAEMEQLFPEALKVFTIDPVAHPLPGGEDPRAATERGVACLHDIAEMHPEGRVLVVTHSTLLRLALCQLIGLPLAQYRNVFPIVYNCTLTEINLTGKQASLLMFNAPMFQQTGGETTP